jgi:hypothetical protein
VILEGDLVGSDGQIFCPGSLVYMILQHEESCIKKIRIAEGFGVRVTCHRFVRHRLVDARGMDFAGYGLCLHRSVILGATSRTLTKR